MKNIPDYLSKTYTHTHTELISEMSIIINLLFSLTLSVPETLRSVVNPLSRRKRRKRKEKSKPEGISKTSFKVRVGGAMVL